MKEGFSMDTAWNAEDVERDDTPRPWNGSHAKPRASLRLMFANGTRQALSYSDYRGYRLRNDVLSIYFTTATVVCTGRHLDDLAALIEDEAARYIREQHKSPFEVQRHESVIERLELQPPQPDALSRKG
jgi:hypothetical protein